MSSLLLDDTCFSTAPLVALASAALSVDCIQPPYPPSSNSLVFQGHSFKLSAIPPVHGGKTPKISLLWPLVLNPQSDALPSENSEDRDLSRSLAADISKCWGFYLRWRDVDRPGRRGTKAAVVPFRPTHWTARADETPLRATKAPLKRPPGLLLLLPVVLVLSLLRGPSGAAASSAVRELVEG